MKTTQIAVYNHTDIPFLSRAKVEQLWALVSREEGKRAIGRLEITAVDEEDIRRLNDRYFGEQDLTDVIAFPYGVEGSGGMWGEVVICLPQVLRQAGENREDEKKEILTVLTHGFLHLLGYTDQDSRLCRQMETRQNEILKTFLTEEMRRKLITRALRAGKKAYAPYSNFCVGAAIETDKKVVSGCNVENASLGLTVCAERVAVLKAVSENIRSLRRIAVAGSSQSLCIPCGACRQVLFEFAPAIEIIAANNHGRYQVYSLEDLLPHPFVASKEQRRHSTPPYPGSSGE